MIHIKSENEIEKMRKAGRITAKIRDEVAKHCEVGIKTIELDKIAASKAKELGAKCAFKGYSGYPASICISVNEEVVHGIPSSRVLMSGDIVGIDFGVVVDGFFGDSAVTVPVGKISADVENLVKVTQKSLFCGIEMFQEGNRLSDISHAIQNTVEREGFSVVKSFVGHGIGRSLHEEPQVPNFGERGRGMVLKKGLVLAIEPMVNLGGDEVIVLADNWTAVTKDGSFSAHFEHTIALTDKGPEILTMNE